MTTIHAIFENGVFRPTERVELPEKCEVEFEPKLVKPPAERSAGLAKIYAILAERYDSGDPYGAERHNEHQP